MTESQDLYYELYLIISLGAHVISCCEELEKCDIVVNNSKPYCSHWFSVIPSYFGQYDSETDIKLDSV